MARHLAESLDRLENNLKDVIADTEEVIKTGGRDAAEEMVAAKARLGEGVARARSEMRHMRQVALDRGRATATATGELAHEHPWTGMGIAVALGALIGWLLTRR